MRSHLLLKGRLSCSDHTELTEVCRQVMSQLWRRGGDL